VALWRSFIDIMEPSAQTPPVFDVVAPLSEPMKTSFAGVIVGIQKSQQPAGQLQARTPENRNL
jgi:hypothetical protein